MKKRKKSVIASIMLLCAAVVVLTAVVIGGNAVFSIKTLSSSAYNTYENAEDEGYKAEIKSLVQSAVAVIQSEYDKFQAGEKTEDEAKYDAKEAVRAMRYRDDQSGYFWIDDQDYILVMHPILTEDEGKNRYDMQDQNGIMITQEIVKICESTEKGGYNEFYFTKADGVTVAPKIAYSKLFEPWGWVVSTGNYVDDMNAEKAGIQAGFEREYRSLLARINIVFVAAIAAALVIAFVSGKRVIAPLKQIQIFADQLAKGNLTTDVKIKQKNEIGQTAEALRAAQENMRKLLQSITDISQRINEVLGQFDSAFNGMKASISQVGAAVDSIAGNAACQASSTDKASENAVIMADQINRTGEEVESLDQNSKEMSQISEQSMETLQQLIAVNNKTRKSISEMAEQTESTHASVQQIHMAANLINEISDQTSLLALNASIEAARAGEAGKGFAVVADEIAKLASQSADSVEEISRVVEELQDNATKSVEAMREINDSVDIQVNSLTETQNIFLKLHQELNNCIESVQSIDNMTVELETQRSNVTQSLDELNKLAQDNAAAAQETSAMSAELSKVVDNSNRIVEELEEKVSELIQDVNKFTL
ncbi:MAG: cache domain-containing protein [Lachnospiraceae bacterium]|nr:cache domain-containing protein [Lachnospiraceae bacterium]